jgi:uncharacterized membrane protein
VEEDRLVRHNLPRESVFPLLLLILAMLAIIVVAVLVVTYVAYPHRGEEVPGAPWLGEAMTKGVDSLPTLEDDEVEHHRNAS